MAEAMNLAVKSGRQSFLSGAIKKTKTAVATTTFKGKIFKLLIIRWIRS